MLKNYVISLTTANDRREHIQQEFDSKNVAFEFFDAITPNQTTDLVKQFHLNLKHCDLTPNELACLCSQVCLWQKCVDDDLDYIGIFEDDVYLSYDAHLFLNDDAWIPTDFDFIKLEKIFNKVNYNKKTKIHGHDFFILKNSHVGAGGYILSKKCAGLLLDYITTIKIDHIDQILFHHFKNTGTLPIYQINPVLCIQDCILYPHNQKFASSLQWREKTADQATNKPKLNIIQKIIKELIRPLKQIYHLFFPIDIKLIFNHQQK